MVVVWDVCEAPGAVGATVAFHVAVGVWTQTGVQKLFFKIQNNCLISQDENICVWIKDTGD